MFFDNATELSSSSYYAHLSFELVYVLSYLIDLIKSWLCMRFISRLCISWESSCHAYWKDDSLIEIEILEL